MVRYLLIALALGALAFPSPAAAQDSVTVSIVRTLVDGHIPIAPTPYHAFIYRMMEECTGIKGDFSRIIWHTARALVVVYSNGAHGSAAGLWRRDPRGVPHVFFTRESLYDGETVSHEILHDLHGGDVPLDVAQRCLLAWPRLHPIT